MSLEQDLLDFLSRKYVVSSDDRQQQMGLGYITAERQDLARSIVHFLQGHMFARPPTKNFPVMLIQAVHGKSTLDQLRHANVPTCVLSMPWHLIEPHEKQADRNHHQSLKTLSHRGGLSSSEMAAVMNDRNYTDMSEVDAQVDLLKHLWRLK